MRKLLIWVSVCLWTLTVAGQKMPYKNQSISVDKRVEDLLKRMTIEEKIGQLMQPVLEGDKQALLEQLRQGRVGSFCVTKYDFPSVSLRDELQRAAIEESRLGIPVIFGFDVIHGFRTLFPIPLGLSASWEPELVRQSAEIAAYEARIAGIDLTFSPMVDVSRDARWGRISECFGEDTYLNALFGQAFVRGYQGEEVSGDYSLGACMKHYVGYGSSIGGRDYQYTELSDRSLRNTYLPPFKAGVEAGALSVMSSFNDISGVPGSANAFTLRKILKDEWKFRGAVISDWDAVIELINHGIAGTKQEAGLAAIKAGVDIEMRSDAYWELLTAIKEKKISEDVIDEAVRRVLWMKFKLGLFEHPYTPAVMAGKDFVNKDFRKVARQASAESMVLLKNNGILPLTAQQKSIAVMGPWADNCDVFGWWTGVGRKEDVITVVEAFRQRLPQGVEMIVGSDPVVSVPSVAIVCVGESGYMFGEDHGRTDLTLPWGQTEMIKQLKERGVPVVAVVFNGRPLVLTEVEKYADAILLAWHPGVEGGNALVDVLYGVVNPSGKLTCSFPKSNGQMPLYYSINNSGRPLRDCYIDDDGRPLYPFGYGLSYTQFKYHQIKAVQQGNRIIVCASVENTGKYSGKEVVQLYFHDKVASIARPRKELKGFKKILLAPGEVKEVVFELEKNELAFYGVDLKKQFEPGEFDIWVGGDSQSGLHTILEVH